MSERAAEIACAAVMCPPPHVLVIISTLDIPRFVLQSAKNGGAHSTRA